MKSKGPKDKRTGGFSPAWLVPALFFAALWICGETGLYSDSQQYIAMHIHREPLYSFFLWIFRTALGDGSYLEAVRLLQNIFAAFSVIWLADCLRRAFRGGTFLSLLFCLLLLAPHAATPFFSVTHLVLSNGILSEALGLPLFYLFAAQCLKMIFRAQEEKPVRQQRSAAVSALVLAVLLALTRGQMMTAILLWGVLALALEARRRFLLRAADRKGRNADVRRGCGSFAAVPGVLLCVVLAFGARTLTVRCYNLVFNGYFVNNTFGNVGLLANMLYAADREDGAAIAEEEARWYFELSWDLADAEGANYRYAPGGFRNRAAHLEQYHDELKFHLIEEPWRAVHDETGLTDYIPENLEQERIAAQIIRGIFPKIVFRWLYDYAALSVCGFLRSAAVARPPFGWYALAFYLIFAGLLCRSFWKNPDSRAAWTAAFSLAAAAANVCATSLIIMCLSRYMIYGMPLLYVGFLLLCREKFKIS